MSIKKIYLSHLFLCPEVYGKEMYKTLELLKTLLYFVRILIFFSKLYTLKRFSKYSKIKNLQVSFLRNFFFKLSNGQYENHFT